MVLEVSFYEQRSVVHKRLLSTHCHRFCRLHVDFRPCFSFSVAVVHVTPCTSSAFPALSGVLSLDQQCSVFVFWDSLGPQAEPRKAVLHCPETDSSCTVTFSLPYLRALRHMSWNITEPHESAAVLPKQSGGVGTIPHAIRQPRRGAFILNISSTTAHSQPSLAFPAWCLWKLQPCSVLFSSMMCSHSEQETERMRTLPFFLSPKGLGRFYICME